ncbi:MAG TPA: hypothetical protein VH817_15405 [Thermoleophilaceae bacterium]|jgi:hypothetical protein
MTDEPQEGAGQPTEEELRAALEEQMKRITVKDVLLQTVITLINVSARKLGLAGEDGEKDLAQAKQGIEGVRALLPLLPEEEQNAVREPLSQLQMAFAQQASGDRPQATEKDPETRDSGPDTADDEREKARSKIWTPPGT